MPTAPEWDVVDESSFESFPASDPPGWIRQHAAPSASTTCPPGTTAIGGPYTRALKRAVIGAAVLGALLTLSIVIYKRRA